MKSKTIRPQKSILLSLLFSLCVGLLACQLTSQNSTQSTTSSSEEMPGAGVKVRAGSGELFVTEVVNIGLEKLGYQTAAIKQLNVAVAHAAVSNGELDFYGTHWEKLHTKFFEQNGGNQKLEKVGVLIKNGLQGYQIDKKTAEQYNIS
ncbi:MAG: glycine betaine ABC transporter substrate-binding protein, partial [Cyanobacteria bacterium J06592_8]